MLSDVALLGFAAAALGYLALAGLLALRGAATAPGRLFVVAVLVEAAWAGAIAAAIGGLRIPLLAVSVAESARLFLWLAFLLSLLRTAGDAGSGAAAAVSPFARVANAGLATAAAIALATVAMDALAFGQQSALIVRVIGSVFALVCLEQVYRSSPQGSRWALKFLAVAVLALFGFDLVMYSEALLFSRMNPALWTARGYANALLVPLLAIAAARNRTWKLDITVSRQVVFHTATLIAAGVYLILMAAGGYWVRWFGGAWGEVAQALFVFGALVALAVALGSGTVRARLRVFLAKNFFSYRYDYRTEWLKLTELLSGANPREAQGSLEERSIRGLAALVESTGGALWLAGEHGEFTCAARSSYRGATPNLFAGEPMLVFLRTRQWVIDLAEWREKPATYDDLRAPPALADDPENWLIVPLMLHEELTGFVVLTRPLTPSRVDWEVRDALKAAARQVASYLAVRRAVEALVTARQFESFNRMSAFVVHDLKNLVAQLSLLTANAAKHRHNPEFQDDMLDTVQNVLARMQGLLMQLRSGTKPIEKPSPVRVGAVVQAALQGKRGLRPEPELSVAPGVEDVVVAAHADRLERVIGHLVQNAAEATPNDGRIWVRLRREGEQALIEVEDTGRGMSERFVREELFRPFASTKEHGMGIGTFESREYIRELGGTLDVASREQAGSTFRIRLPLVSLAAAA